MKITIEKMLVGTIGTRTCGCRYRKTAEESRRDFSWTWMIVMTHVSECLQHDLVVNILMYREEQLEVGVVEAISSLDT